MTLKDIVKNFTTTPFLFVGSGITRRYLNLPDWKGLLQEFVSRVDRDLFAYAKYENRAKETSCPSGVLPKVAELLEADFNKLWFDDKEIRKCDNYYLHMILEGICSPFKAEIAYYIKEVSSKNVEYEHEIEEFQKLSKKVYLE